MRWTLWLKAVFTAVAVALLVKMLLVTSCIIPSSGMENSLYQGEGILVNKWSYGLRVPFPSLWGYHRLGKKPVEKGISFFLITLIQGGNRSGWNDGSCLSAAVPGWQGIRSC